VAQNKRRYYACDRGELSSNRSFRLSRFPEFAPQLHCGARCQPYNG